ncbi:hypothetical protein Q1695_007934 [Nippostrongylus brasiliensis]|nr:hypothetical protein Q1695_007934 [Nippostrongylus brasiliensis]
MAMLIRRTLRLAACVERVAIPVRAFSATTLLSAERKYTKKHEWVLVDGKHGTVGITDFAAEQLGDIVFVELPEKDSKVVKGESTGAVESVKAASDIYAPASGIVIEKNDILEQNPGKINKSPFDEGWLYKVELSNVSELSELLSEKEYQNFKEEGEGSSEESTA